jgi:hypothetical protein
VGEVSIAPLARVLFEAGGGRMTLRRAGDDGPDTLVLELPRAAPVRARSSGPGA